MSTDEMAERNIEPAVEGPASLYKRARLGERIRQAIDDLPERYRLSFILYVEEDFTLEETAELIGMSINAVVNRVKRAKLILAGQLGDCWESFWTDTDWGHSEDEEGLASAAA